MNIKSHVYRHFLNLDYNDGLSAIDVQTNRLIAKNINILNNKIKEIENPVIIFEDHNDKLSDIAYNILICIKTVAPKCTIYNYGKNKRKGFQHLNFIKKILLKNKENIIYVTPINPIYKVLNNTEKFNILRRDSFNILERFTIEELVEAGKFYNVDVFNSTHYIRGLSAFQNFYNTKENYKNIPELKEKYDIIFINLTGTNKDFEIFDEIKNTNDICFYYCDEDKIKDIVLCGINFYIENKNNAITKDYNVNRRFNKNELLDSNIGIIKFMGEWNEELRKKYGI